MSEIVQQEVLGTKAKARAEIETREIPQRNPVEEGSKMLQ